MEVIMDLRFRWDELPPRLRRAGALDPLRTQLRHMTEWQDSWPHHTAHTLPIGAVHQIVGYLTGAEAIALYRAKIDDSLQFFQSLTRLGHVYTTEAAKLRMRLYGNSSGTTTN